MYLIKGFLISTMLFGLSQTLYGQNDSNSPKSLLALKASLQSAQIIGLGEDGHGYETFNQVKADVAAYLLENYNASAIVFESPFTECVISYLNQYPLKERMQVSLYPFWNTTSVGRALQAFLQREKALSKPTFWGCDIQEDCRYTELSHFLITNQVVKERKKELEQCDSLLSFYIGKNFSRRNLAKDELAFLHGNYDKVIHELNAGKEHSAITSKLLIRCLENRKWLCTYLSIKDVKEKMYFRDSLMAENTIWIRNNFFTMEPLLLWAANTHVSKLKDENSKPRWLGEWLSQNSRYNYYAVSVQKGSWGASSQENSAQSYSIKFSEGGKSKYNAVIYCKNVVKIQPGEWVTPCP